MDQKGITSQKIFHHNPTSIIDNRIKFLLCVDPDSKQIYTINLRNNQINIEQNVPTVYRMKAEKDIQQIQKLIQLPGSSWDMKAQRNESYRRRQLSEYLLHKIINQEPTYLAQSQLSEAFNNVNSLTILVDVSQYLKLEDQDYKFNILNPITIEMNVDLVSCADGVVNKILKKVYNIFQVRLTLHSNNNKFTLQIAGFREFLWGNYPLIQYDRVRQSLRGLQHLQLVLTELPKSRKVFDNFPPIFERVITTKGDLSPIPWEKFVDVPCFLFYAPYQLHKYLGEPISVANIDSSRMYEQAKPLSRSIKQLRPRVFMKEKCLEFIDLRRKQLEHSIIQLEKSILYSGECDYPFSIKLIGVTEIHRLFILDDKEIEEFRKYPKRRATYNGLCAPRYITKASAKQEEQHNTSKKKAKVDDDEKHKKKAYAKLSKVKDPEPNYVRMLSRHNFNPHLINHGGSGTAHMEYLQSRYELDLAPYLISVEVLLLYGETGLTKDSIVNSGKIPFRKLCRWDKVIKFGNLKISQLPMETRLCFNVIIHSVSGEAQVIGSTVTEAFDENGKIKQGALELNLWPFYKVDQRVASYNEYYGNALNQANDHQYYCKILIQLPVFEEDMYWSLRDERCMTMLGFPVTPQNRNKSTTKDAQMQERIVGFNFSMRKHIVNDWKSIPTQEELAKIQPLLKYDPLIRNNYSQEDKFLLLKCRNYYKDVPSYFPIFLSAISWSEPDQVREVYQMIKVWAPLPPDDALPLLDAGISDELVRYYATRQVSLYRDDELILFMLELTQCLMFEQCHFSPLGEMLIERSLMNPWGVGHEFFWQLRSQLHIQYSYERYSLLLEQIMMLFGQYRYEVLGEVQVNDEIMEIAENVKLEKDPTRRLNEMRSQLSNIRSKLPPKFQHALDPRMSSKEFIYEKCKILQSKKQPLWLTLSSAEIKDENEKDNNNKKIVEAKDVPDPASLLLLKKQKEEKNVTQQDKTMVIFKCGDDIRQDLLTLQLIKIMDKIWLSHGFDYRMKPYKVISTLDQVGMIEVVLNSETTSQIHENAGRFGALNKSSIMEYLKKHNKNNMDNAVENFLRTCAGYCVATYVLGIGDRHSGNIMLTQSGHLFHIDFGHFLGNFKIKLGFKRERTPFVFTQEMAYVMGGINGVNFQRFEEFCTKAYNQLRKHSNLFINIFLLNLSAGMPELQEMQDIEYLKQKLQLDIGDQQATELFRKEIISSLNDMWRKIDNLIHNFRN